MKPGTTKPLIAARQTTEATVSTENTSQTPTAVGPQLEDPCRAATAKAVPATVVAAPEVVVEAAVAVAAAAEAHLTVLAEELVAAAIAEAEATRTSMSPAVHMAATTPACDAPGFYLTVIVGQLC
jgi:hypothetical protein